MTYDRTINICTAGTRDALIWKPTAMSWGALVERLWSPLVGT